MKGEHTIIAILTVLVLMFGLYAYAQKVKADQAAETIKQYQIAESGRAGVVEADVIAGGSKIYPIILPVQNIVAAGTKFKGDLFITAASSRVSLTMAINRTSGYPEASKAELEVTDGKGKVSFTATPGVYNKDGQAEKKFMTFALDQFSLYYA